MVKLADQIEERSPQILSEYRQKLETKVKELLIDIRIGGRQDRCGSCDVRG